MLVPFQLFAKFPGCGAELALRHRRSPLSTQQVGTALARVERTLRVGARVAATWAEGPGARYVVWLQGCGLRCPGCCNPHFFDPEGGETIPVSVLLAEMAAPRATIEGLTLLGGEPFEQAEALVPLVRGARDLGLSVIVFSGYTLEELTTRADARALLSGIDVLVDGRYEAGHPERERLWVGSTNQRFHYLTDRYSQEIERPAPGAPLRSVEVRLGTDGRWSANGWPIFAR